MRNTTQHRYSEIYESWLNGNQSYVRNIVRKWTKLQLLEFIKWLNNDGSNIRSIIDILSNLLY